MSDEGRIAGVIFDLDGTLYRITWVMRPLLTMKILPHILRLPRFLKIRQRFAGKEMGSRDELLDAISEILARSEKIPASQAKNWILESFYPAFISVMSVFRGSRSVATILESLKNAGIKLAVLSDYAQVEERMNGLGIAHSYFDLVTSSETAGALKPSPRPFLDIASKWGISPDKILVVGDRNDTDGEAARAAGMKFLKVNNRPASEGKTWNEAVEELKLLC